MRIMNIRAEKAAVQLERDKMEEYKIQTGLRLPEGQYNRIKEQAERMEG